MKEQDYDVKVMSILIKFLAYSFRWVFLINCVLCAGFTLGLLVMLMVKGSDMPQTMLSTMVALITKYSASDVLDLVEAFGFGKLMVATLGYGFSSTIFYGVLHSLTYKFIKLFDSIISGNMFTKENIDLINGSLLQSIIASFIMPLTISAISSSTNIFSLSKIDISSILFFIVVYITKRVFTSGYELSEKNNKNKREISEIKASIAEEKMNAIKETSKIVETAKKPKKNTKKNTTSAKKTTSK